MFCALQTVPHLPKIPVIRMGRPVCHIVAAQLLHCRHSQPGAAWAEDAASSLAWRPRTLSSEVPPLSWGYLSGGTRWDSGHGDLAKSWMMGREWGDTYLPNFSLIRRCLRSWRPELAHPYSDKFASSDPGPFKATEPTGQDLLTWGQWEGQSSMLASGAGEVPLSQHECPCMHPSCTDIVLCLSPTVLCYVWGSLHLVE